jgi:hypothetical protein
MGMHQATEIGVILRVLAEDWRDGMRLAIDSLPIPIRETLEDLLGKGKIEASAAGLGVLARETALPGLWLVDDGKTLEIGALPMGVVAVLTAAGDPDWTLPDAPDGAATAPALLADLRQRAKFCQTEDRSSIVSLDRLPLVPADHAMIDAALGKPTITLIARGEQICVMESTQCRHLWRVTRHSTGEDLPLHTLEIAVVPVAARSNPADIEQSRDDVLRLIRTAARR